MLCSVCKKNTAVIFINKNNSDNKSEVEGYCYNCAMKKGVNPLGEIAKQANISEKDLNDMTNKIESMLSGIATNIDGEELSNVMEADIDDDEIEQAGGIPLGSIFSGIFNTWNFDNLFPN